MHVIIEIAISMVGLYIIFSIVNSALVEGYAQLVNKRGKHLKKSLDNFFQDPENASINLANDIYNHKLIRAFMEKKSVLPSYIDPKIFTQAFMELIFKDTHTAGAKFTGEKKEGADAKLPGELDKTLQFILNKASDGNGGIDMGEVQNEIERLYSTYMVRVSEWYKKQMKYVLAVTGIILAFSLNLDSIIFFNALKNDGELRREQVQIARNLDANQETIQKTVEDLKANIQMDSLNTKDVQKGLDEILTQVLGEDDFQTFDANLTELKIGFHRFTEGKTSTKDYLWGFLGIFLTGFALSFGSAFWFKLLKKLVGK